MIKVWVGVFLVGLFCWVVYEINSSNAKANDRKERDALKDELSDTKEAIEDVNLEEVVVDAKIHLKEREKAVETKSKKLDKKDKS